MKNGVLVLATVAALGLSSVAALAAEATVEGTVSGYTCVIMGKECPVDKEDPVVAMESMFVVVKPDGAYYLIPNIDRAVLARHLTEKVRVKGDVNDKYKSIQAKSLDAFAKDKWRTVWSQAMVDETMKAVYGP